MTELARTNKELLCSRHGRVDLPALVVAVRAGKTLAGIELGEMGRHNVVKAARMAIMGWDADAVGIITESYQTGLDPVTGLTYRKNPLNGQDWGYPPDSDRGWMQILAEDHNGIEKGWVLECISVMAVNRAGDAALASLPYRWAGSSFGKPTFTWVEDKQKFNSIEENPGNDQSFQGGFLVDELVAAMNEPDSTQRARDLGLSLSREERDTATAYMLHSAGHRVAWWEDDQPHIMDFLTVRI